jgi:glycosyltransferase 2 family protein
MTVAGPSRDERAVPARRPWSPSLLAETELGRRNRRTVDAAFLLLAAIVIGLTAVAASSAERQDEDVAQALQTVLGWADSLWRLAFVGLLVLALVVVLDVVLERRWIVARDLVVAALVVVGAGVVLGGVVRSDWVPAEDHLLSNWGYPELRLAAATAILVVAGPELVRWVRLLAASTMPFATIGAVVLGSGLPSDALGALALGVGAGAIVRLAFGSAAGVPPTEHVRAGLAALGVDVDELVPAIRQRVGYAEYVGRDTGGSVKVRVLGRDAQDTQRLARRWRLLAYRDPTRSAPVGRLEQVEHEALALLMAAQAGVRVPEVVIAALGPEGDALIVTRQPDVAALELASPDEVSDETLLDLFRQVDQLHRASISHGRLNLSNVLLSEDGPMLVDLSAATLGAPQAALDIDVAELLVATCCLVGPERALARAVEGGFGDALARIQPYLQRAALTPHTRDLARTHDVGLKELRAAVGEATATAVPEIAAVRRIRPRDVLAMAALVFAAYLLISQLADIGFDTIADELGKAELAWVLLALILAQAAFIGSGISVRGAVPVPLPLLPCVVLQSAIKFINLTVPSSAGRIGMNLRFLQRQGVPGAQAVASGAVDDASETMVQAALLLVALSFVNVNLDTSRFSGTGPDARLLIGIGVALLVSAIVLLTVPKVRNKLLPEIQSALAGLWSVARVRRKRVELFGGNVLSELTYALALGATCLAYGHHLNLAELVFVNSATAILSGLIPAPGGIGAAEAALAAGLIAVGVDKSTAFAIAITQRLCTFYLPPIWGYFSLRWLGNRGYI